jgi:enoyl-CoA hydratase/carnithine racemase
MNIQAARYYACSGSNIYGNDGYALGLLSHLVEEEPHFALTRALASSISPE